MEGLLPALLAGIIALAVGAHLFVRATRNRCKSWQTIDQEDTIKVGGSAKKLKEVGEVDYIVIGSGLGGLTTAALLCKVGYKVLVVEQHDRAGGATHTFTHSYGDQGDEFEFDVGVHYLGERLQSSWSPIRRMFDIVSSGKLEWSACHDVYDMAVNMQNRGSDGEYEKIPFHKDHSKNLAELERRFPGSGPALKKYRRLCMVSTYLSGLMFMIHKLTPRFLLPLAELLIGPFYGFATKRTAVQVMREDCGMSDDLIGACSYFYGDYGMPPGRTPFMVQALLERHYQGGGYFPRGGSASIAKTIVQTIQQNGGRVMVRCPVQSILVSGGRAVGVLVKGVEVRARRGVVSNAGALNTFQRLLPESTARPHIEPLSQMDALQPSVRLIYLFVGLDGSDEELKLSGRNYWLLNGWDHDKNWDQLNNAESYEDIERFPAVFLSFGSAKDDSFKGRHSKPMASLQLLAPVSYKWFEKWSESKFGKRDKDYEANKKVWEERLLSVLYDVYPQTKGRVVFTELGSPITTNFYLNTLKGENYGLEHNMGRFTLKAQRALHTETAVKNLYMVGQDSFSVGVIAALASGFLTAIYISPSVLAVFLLEFLFA